MKILLVLILCILPTGCNFMGLTHGPGERVVFLDGSESLVPIDPVRLGTEYNYKAVTTNQNLSDVTSIPFTWRGGTVRPLAPVNIRGSRNAAGDLLIEWTRRSRTGAGMRPNSDVPLSEETELYEIEIYNGASLLRTVRAMSGAVPVLWTNTGAYASITPASDGTLLQTAEDTPAQLQSIQRINGDFVLETTIDNSVRMGNIQTDGIVRILPVSGFWDVDNATAPGYFHGDGGNDLFENDPALQVFDLVSGSRLMIELTGKTFKYYKDYAGPQTQPLYISTRTNIPFPLMIQADLNGSAFTSPIVLDNVTRPTIWLPYGPSYLYNADQQTADFGSIQSSVKVRIRQISAVVGRGAYCEATI
jgi:hypothetical protein